MVTPLAVGKGPFRPALKFNGKTFAAGLNTLQFESAEDALAVATGIAADVMSQIEHDIIGMGYCDLVQV